MHTTIAELVARLLLEVLLHFLVKAALAKLKK
jgi:hypothetical protein